MITLYVLYTLLAVTVGWLLYASKAHRAVKGAALVLLTIFGLTMYQQYVSALGAPLQGVPEGEFVYVHHEVKGDNINLWVWTEGRGDRLHTFPYSQEAAEELEQAKEKTEGGVPQSGEFPPGEDGVVTPEALEFDDYTKGGEAYTK
jgi:hypothetical protein